MVFVNSVLTDFFSGLRKSVPPFPPKNPSFPLPKNKECYFSLGGTGGTLLLNIAVVPLF